MVISTIWIWLQNSFLITIKCDIFIDFWNALSHVPSHPQYPDSCMQHTRVEERWMTWQWQLGQRCSIVLGKVPVQQLLIKHGTEEVNITISISEVISFCFCRQLHGATHFLCTWMYKIMLVVIVWHIQVSQPSIYFHMCVLNLCEHTRSICFHTMRARSPWDQAAMALESIFCS